MKRFDEDRVGAFQCGTGTPPLGHGDVGSWLVGKITYARGVRRFEELETFTL